MNHYQFSNRLGSFELDGTSNTFFNGFGEFGVAAEELQADINNLNYDYQKAQRSPRQSPMQGMGIPFYSPSADWLYPKFRAGNYPPVRVESEAPALMAQKQQQLGQVGSFTKQEDETSAGEVLTGIAAILAPLTKAGIGIYAASQQAKFQKAQMKMGISMGPSGPIVVQGGGISTGIIILIVMMFIIIGVVIAVT